ncbi:translation initiation factor 3 [Shimia litoralis]|uniref:Translation initiation factor 3 n=2 Tax=Shimia litoralis TaxID=420403 RepID=A0A4U7N7P1_9RHOB|nr:translation initiation factor 3 [Shimia litoralis]
MQEFPPCCPTIERAFGPQRGSPVGMARNCKESLTMKNLIIAVVVLGAGVVGYVLLTGQKGDDTAPTAQAPSAVETVTEQVQSATEEAAEAASDVVTDMTDSATDAMEDAATAVEETVDTATEAAEGAMESASDAVTEAADTAQDAVSDVVEDATTAAESAADTATEAASEAMDAVTPTTDTATDAATDAVTDAATDTATEAASAAAEATMADVLTVDGFDMGKVSEMIDQSSLDAMKKTALKTGLQQAQDNPEMLKAALDGVKSALGM